MVVDRAKLQKKYGEEEVMIVPEEHISFLNEGFTRNTDELFSKFFDGLEKKVRFIPRWQSDFNPEEVEPIPYVTVMNESLDRVFLYKRIKGSGEKRLVDKTSIGVGGHVNPEDGIEDPNVTIMKSVGREIMEELTITPAMLNRTGLGFQGFIRSTKSEVDKDHVALVFILVVPDDMLEDIKVRETEVLEGEFVPVDEIGKQYATLENWSKIVYESALKLNQKGSKS